MKSAALIHAGSMTVEDKLDSETISRLTKGIELMENREAEHLVIGAGEGSKATQTQEGIFIRVGYTTINMGHEMTSWLSKQGLGSRYVMCAPWGRDTVGEIYFSQQHVLKPRGWKEIIAVTNEWHSTRAKILHEFILGPEYRTQMVTVRSLADVLPSRDDIDKEEQGRLKQFFDHFGDIKPGDSRSIEKRLYDTHVLYKGLPEMKRIRFYE
jgi:hypothetical protein